jgi:hypothetical protein
VHVARELELSGREEFDSATTVQYLKQIVQVLSYFHRATKALEGDLAPTLALVIPKILELLYELEEPEVSHVVTFCVLFLVAF